MNFSVNKNSMIEEEQLRLEKIRNMFLAKSKMVETILAINNEELLDAYFSYAFEEEYTLDEFVQKAVQVCCGETFRKTIFDYMLAIISINEEMNRVNQRKTYVVE